jgi:hypothetical protein
MMHQYKVEVTRDGRWWMVNVPEIDQLTQARRITEIAEMARSLIAVSTGEPLDRISVDIVSITVPDVGNIQSTAIDIVHLRDQAANATKKAQLRAAEFAKQLTAAGIPVRDAGELLGISPQRISQLALERQVHEDDEARRMAKVFPYSVDVSIFKVAVNGVLIVAISERLDEDLRAMGLGTNTLDGMLAGIAERATPTPGNALMYESTVASRLGGAPKRVLIEQFAPNAARIDYAR